MNSEPFNPYAPPEAPAPLTGLPARRRLWGEMVARALAVIGGFSLVADPTSLPGINTALGQVMGGYVFARGLGLALLALGFLPWPGSRRAGERPDKPAGSGRDVEEL